MRRKLAIAVATLLGLSGTASAQILPSADYRFVLAAPCIEDAERAAKPARPGDARYDVCVDQMALYAKAHSEAKAQGKLLMVTFGATWCPWCATLQKAMHGPELLGHKGGSIDLGQAFHHVEIGLSMIHKGKKVEIPSGEAVLALVLRNAPEVKIRAIPFLAVVDPKGGSRVYARNIDDVARKDGTHDLARVRGLLAEAHAFIAASGAAPSEPGWIARKWRRWWHG